MEAAAGPHTDDEERGRERHPSISEVDLKMESMMNRKGELPDDLACFLQQQKQRQARLETTMRSFPSSADVAREAELEKQELKRKRTAHEDPMSHRIIEKRRRDRMNNCLADLSRLIPSSYLKKGRGRIEKTEIIEMAIRHMKHLQHHPCSKPEGCDLQNEIEQGLSKTNSVESFRVGYHECLTESMHFLVEKQGLYAGDPFCVRMMSHLQKHYDKLGRPSTSEIHSTVGGTWSGAGLPSESQAPEAEGRARDRSGIKSEFGAVSEESGYSSLKTEEETGRTDDGLRGGKERSRSYSSPERQREKVGEQEREERYRRFTEERPSDLSIHPEQDLEPEPEEGASHNYKFKSTIRHRFDMGAVEVETPSVKRRRGTGEEDQRLETQRQPSAPPEVKPEASFLQASQPFTLPKPLCQPVPIFALNSKGSFYVPLTLDLSLLTPFLPLLTEEEAGPFHPVTISVNFRTSAEAAPPREEEREWRRGHGVIQQASVIKQWREPV